MCGHVGLPYWASPMMLHPSSFKNKSATNKNNSNNKDGK